MSGKEGMESYRLEYQRTDNKNNLGQLILTFRMFIPGSSKPAIKTTIESYDPGSEDDNIRQDFERIPGLHLLVLHEYLDKPNLEDFLERQRQSFPN